MKTVLAAFTLALLVTPAFAQPREEPVGCDKFKWPLDNERALLTATETAKVASGATVAAPIGKALIINLGPFVDAKLPVAPERAPRSPAGKAGYVKVGAPPQAGAYHITLSAGGWIDVVQDDRLVKSGAFSGATGCDGVRKSVTFDLAAKPFVVQFSSVPSDTIGIVMTPLKP